MVRLTELLWAAKRGRLRNFLRKGFMDSLRLHAVGGNGGAGLPNLGGRGGRGGSVACVGAAHASLSTILRQHKEHMVQAARGSDSTKKMILGPPGEDLLLEVPVGVTLYHEGEALGEINAVGEQLLMARGGEGGGPSNGWAGRAGEARSLQLELRLIADVGLLGFPNAGKSTFLRAVSRAKPKVASYPFTTVRPNIGTMVFPDLRQISVADLPGLVEGAHLNIGMGHRFLRHVERTRLLVMVVDVNGFSLSVQHKHRTCLENVLLLNKELEMYNPELLSKPALLVVNKMDTPGAEERLQQLRHTLEDPTRIRACVPDSMVPQELLRLQEIIGVSAAQNQGVDQAKDTIRILLDLAREEELEKQGGQSLQQELGDFLKERGPALT